jgi:phospholipase/carboxylesterase
MPAWYDIKGSDLVSRQDAEGIARSALAISALIEFEISRGIAPENIVLAGFSQGCAMALHTGLRFGQRLAGIMALSGYLPLAERLATERNLANAATPIFMAHGSQDPVVVPAWGESSRDLLNQLGYPVQWHSYPMAHSVHPREVADISTFLTRVLNPRPTAS